MEKGWNTWCIFLFSVRISGEKDLLSAVGDLLRGSLALWITFFHHPINKVQEQAAAKMGSLLKQAL